MKQLQKRVRELEQLQEVQSNVTSNEGATSSCEVNSSSNDYYCGGGGPNEILPEVKVRVLQKEVLIIIHCEKHKGIMLKILSQLENVNLSIVNSSVLRFGKSTLDITIVAQVNCFYHVHFFLERFKLIISLFLLSLQLNQYYISLLLNYIMTHII